MLTYTYICLLQKYERLFEKEDKQRKQELNQELIAYRRRVSIDFFDLLTRNQRLVKQQVARRVLNRGGFDENDDRNYVVETTVCTIYLLCCTYVCDV